MSPGEDFSPPVTPLLVLQPKTGQLGPGEARGTGRQGAGGVSGTSSKGVHGMEPFYPGGLPLPPILKASGFGSCILRHPI